MANYKKIIITTDGSCGPTNPGMMRMGLIVQGSRGPGEDAPILGAISRDLNWGTSNEAEYLCILSGINWALEYGAEECIVFTDSQLCERQLNGGYSVKSPRLKKIYREIKQKMPKCGAAILWHSREDGLGPLADSLAKGNAESEKVFKELVKQIDPNMEEV